MWKGLSSLPMISRPSQPGPSVTTRAGWSAVAATAKTSAVDEPALIFALQRGEEWAFEAMVRLYGGRLLAVARRICGNEDDARDVLQSSYLSAFRSMQKFEGSCQLSTWLHRIVVNMALMRLRKSSP